jgi:hypothetical protein
MKNLILSFTMICLVCGMFANVRAGEDNHDLLFYKTDKDANYSLILKNNQTGDITYLTDDIFVTVGIDDEWNLGKLDYEFSVDEEFEHVRLANDNCCYLIDRQGVIQKRVVCGSYWSLPWMN